MALRLAEIAQLSDTGLVRAHNEDRSLAVPPLLAVADGMGGAKAGEVAAQMTVDALAGTGPSPRVEHVEQAIADANREIRELAAADADHAGMGTTLTALVVGDERATVLHVGDSRAYVIRGDRVRQVTQDHSLVAELVRQGQLSPDEAERHPSRNIITRALGAEADVAVDRVPLDLHPGDVVLLCSDGLSTMVDPEEIVGLVTGATSLQSAARNLVQAALSAGGTDNVTVVLARMADADGPPETDGAGPPADATAELPVTAERPTVELKPAAPPPGVLVPAHPARRRTVARRVAGLAAVVIAVLLALGWWAGSRTYFVGARDGDATVHVYHGPPLTIAGVSLYGPWADTTLDAAAVRAVNPDDLGGGASGKGEAITRAATLVWRYGLPEITPVTAPPRPATRPATPAT